MELDCEKVHEATGLTMKGRMDAVTAPDFERRCSEWLDQGENAILVDFNQLDYISSAGLRTIPVVSKKLKRSGGQIFFCGAHNMALSILSLANFTSLFPVYESFDEAPGHLCR